MVMKFADYKQYLSPVLVKNTDLVIEKAHGLYMTDVNGDEYLDIVQGIAVNVFGHTPEKVVKAIQDQAANIIHGSFNLANYPSTLTLAKRLAEKAPGEGDKKLTSIFFTKNPCGAASPYQWGGVEQRPSVPGTDPPEGFRLGNQRCCQCSSQPSVDP